MPHIDNKRQTTNQQYRYIGYKRTEKSYIITKVGLSVRETSKIFLRPNRHRGWSSSRSTPHAAVPVHVQGMLYCVCISGHVGVGSS